MNNEWSFTGVWNDSLSQREERPVEPREKLWASELGKAPVDLFLKLKGIVPTNPPNARSLRKFEMGNLCEWNVEMILKRAGILRSTQDWLKYQYEGMLPVTGKLDFIAGGKPDYEKALWDLESLSEYLPPLFIRGGQAILKHFQAKYPEGLGLKILEVKSVSSFMYEAIENSNKSSYNHRIQLFHYLKAKDMKRGSVVYFCKDDARMIEIPVLNPSPIEDEYKMHIKVVSKYYYADTQPPLEKPVVFEDDFGKFSKNWKVAYSPYLTMLYKFKNQKEFDDEYQKVGGRWNRVLRRAKEGKKMTPLNEEVKREITNAGFNFDLCVSKHKIGKATNDEE